MPKTGARTSFNNKPYCINHWLVLRALTERPMRATELRKATSLSHSSVYFVLNALMAKGYVVQDRPRGPYRITEKGVEALKRRSEGERIVKEEVLPQLKRAIELGLNADTIERMFWKAMMRVRT
jgi:DNA-binding IclR family transcriptional regulator